MDYTYHIKLNPVAPYNFALSARIFTGGDPQISKYEDNEFWQVIKTNNQLILMLIESTGTVAEPELSVTLKSDKKISEEDVNPLKTSSYLCLI